MTFAIAIAKRTQTSNWKNVEVTWDQLTAKLGQPLIDSITVEEYQALDKDGRGKAKDVGGYVAGFLKDGLRRMGHVQHRSLLTPEFDSLTPADAAALILKLDTLGLKAFLHSTRSHTPELPRFRVVVVPSRDVTEGEYGPVVQALVTTLGRAGFDEPSSIKATQFMHFPSLNSDGEWIAEEFDGQPFDVDAALSNSGTVAPTVMARGTLSDPRNKPNIVGLFCRAWPDIRDAMREFIPDVYEEASDYRWRMKGATGQDGLIIDSDLLHARSFHTNDPAEGQSLNAFDMVRIHLFGKQDSNSVTGIKDYERPSFISMAQKVAAKDKGTIEEFAKDPTATWVPTGKVTIRATSTAHFGPRFTGRVPITELDRAGNNSVAGTGGNYVKILARDGDMVEIYYDEFADCYRVRGRLPWDRAPRHTDQFINEDYSLGRVWMEDKYGIRDEGRFKDAIDVVGMATKVHPVREYLEKLQWDGTPRIATLFTEWLGVENTHYSREVARIFLTGMVKRVMEPGCKFDTAPLLIGPQGCGKSLFSSKLGAAWFNDSQPTAVGGKDFYEQLRGGWVHEFSEMNVARKADIEAMKQVMSQTHFKYRGAYEKKPKDYAAHHVIIGTTNDKDVLRDPTGNRRWLPLRCGVVPVARHPYHISATKDVEQWHAEAMELWKQNGTVVIDAKASISAKAAQESATAAPPWAAAIELWVNKKVPDMYHVSMPLIERKQYWLDEAAGMVKAVKMVDRGKVCVPEIWVECLGRALADLTPQHSAQIRSALDALEGWERKKNGDKGRLVFGPYGRETAWVRSYL